MTETAADIRRTDASKAVSPCKGASRALAVVNVSGAFYAGVRHFRDVGSASGVPCRVSACETIHEQEIACEARRGVQKTRVGDLEALFESGGWACDGMRSRKLFICGPSPLFGSTHLGPSLRCLCF